jgi:hypothetical protein
MAIDWAMYYLKLVGTIHNQVTQTGYWFMTNTQVEDWDHAQNCNDLIFKFNNDVMPHIKQWANQEWHFIGLVAATMYPRNGPIVERVYETVVGDQIGECLPSFNSGVLSLRTGLGGRSHLGRTYYPGISEGDHESSLLNAPAFTRLQSIGDALLTGFGATAPDSIFYYGVYSHKLGDVPLPAPAVGKMVTPAGFTVISQCLARRRIATMRKRMLGHGI